MSQFTRPVFNIMYAKQLLAAREMSVAALARRMGLTRQAVGHWIRGRGEPDVRQLKAMATELGCHWLELVHEDATVLFRAEDIARHERISGLDAATVAEIDAYIAFKEASQQR